MIDTQPVKFYEHWSEAEADFNKFKYFNANEFFCPATKSLKVCLYDIAVLDSVRQHLGKPIIITSAYRSPEYNKQISPATGLDGPHTTGRAFDIAAVSNSYRRVLLAEWNYHVLRGGIGIYKTHFHFDFLSDRVWHG